MKRPLSVMFFDNAFTFGGSIVSLSYMLKGIDKSKIEPVVVSGQPIEYLENNFLDCTCYHLIPKLKWVNNYKYLKLVHLWPFRRSKFLRSCLNRARFCYWLVFIILPEAFLYFRMGRRHNVSLLHINNGYTHLPYILAAKMLRVPCIVHLRGFEKVSTFTRLTASLVDSHVAISTAIFENIRQLGVSEERISLVYDAIDLSEFSTDFDSTDLKRKFGLTSEQPVYGLFGRVIPWKGTREFILAAQEVDQEIPEARGFIVGDVSDGDQSYYEELQTLVNELGLEGKIIFTGYRTDVPAIMGIMDVVVHASTEPEPFGMVIIEGMAMAKPVVATCAGGPLDIVQEGENGYLVEIGNVNLLAKAVATLLKDPALCREMGKKGRARVEKVFNNQLYGQKMEQIFSRVTSSDKDIINERRLE